MEEYFGFVLLVIFAGVTAGGMVALSQYLGPKRSGAVHDLPFECGNFPSRIVRGGISVKFFVVGLEFILFDIELIFLFAWAVVFRELGLFGYGAMLIFLLAFLAGLLYTVKKGAFEWK